MRSLARCGSAGRCCGDTKRGPERPGGYNDHNSTSAGHNRHHDLPHHGYDAAGRYNVNDARGYVHCLHHGAPLSHFDGGNRLDPANDGSQSRDDHNLNVVYGCAYLYDSARDHHRPCGVNYGAYVHHGTRRHVLDNRARSCKATPR